MNNLRTMFSSFGFTAFLLICQGLWAFPSPDSVVSIHKDISMKSFKSTELISRTPYVFDATFLNQPSKFELKPGDVTCAVTITKQLQPGDMLKQIRELKESGSTIISKGTYEIHQTTYFIEQFSHSEPKSVVRIIVGDDKLSRITCFKLASQSGRAPQYPTIEEINRALMDSIVIE